MKMFSRIATMAIVVLAPVGVLFALQDGAAAGDAAEGGSILMAILTAAIGGAMAAFVGYGKNVGEDGKMKEAFEGKYFVATLGVGVIVGIVGHFWGGLSPNGVIEALEASPIYGGIIFGAEALLKLVWRHGAPQVRGLLESIKAGGKNPTPKPPQTP